MKKATLLLLILSFLTIEAASQTRTRLVDNFDMAQGVRISGPAAPVSAPVKAPEKKLVKKTSQRTMAVDEAVSMNRVDMSGNSLGRMKMSSGGGLGNFTTGDSVIDSYIVDSSNRYGIDPLLIYAQMHQESAFKLKATSHKGASGLMQLMPATARRFGVTNIYEPRQNIDAGVKYMRWLLDYFGGDVNLALAGYNAGEGAVLKFGRQIPPYRETQEYVRKIGSRYGSIRNPNYIRSAKPVTNVEVAKLDKKGAPRTVFESNPIAVRLPDGRMRLVNQ
jgi:hypothetical protein